MHCTVSIGIPLVSTKSIENDLLSTYSSGETLLVEDLCRVNSCRFYEGDPNAGDRAKHVVSPLELERLLRAHLSTRTIVLIFVCKQAAALGSPSDIRTNLELPHWHTTASHHRNVLPSANWIADS